MSGHRRSAGRHRGTGRVPVSGARVVLFWALLVGVPTVVPVLAVPGIEVIPNPEHLVPVRPGSPSVYVAPPLLPELRELGAVAHAELPAVSVPDASTHPNGAGVTAPVPLRVPDAARVTGAAGSQGDGAEENVPVDVTPPVAVIPPPDGTAEPSPEPVRDPDPVPAPVEPAPEPEPSPGPVEPSPSPAEPPGTVEPSPEPSCSVAGHSGKCRKQNGGNVP